MRRAGILFALIWGMAAGASRAQAFPYFTLKHFKSYEGAGECKTLGNAVKLVLSSHLLRPELNLDFAEKFKTQFFALLFKDLDALKLKSQTADQFRAKLEYSSSMTGAKTVLETLEGNDCSTLQETAQIPLELAREERGIDHNWNRLFEEGFSARIEQWKKQNPAISPELLTQYLTLETHQKLESLLRGGHQYFARTVMTALFKLLDPHSTFIATSGTSSAGVTWEDILLKHGIAVRDFSPNGAAIATITPKSEAEAQGLRATDIIREVCGIPVLGKFAPADAENSLPCSPLTLQVQRKESPLIFLHFSLSSPTPLSDDNSKGLNTKVTRFHLDRGNVAVLKIKNFHEHAARNARRQLATVLENHSIDAIVLDLRGNFGGYVREAQQIAGMFVPSSPLLAEKGYSQSVQITYTQSTDAVLWNRPILILVDRESASASELLAGGLQSLGHALIVSQDAATYGKGTIQNVYTASEKFPYGEARVTRAFYYFPNGQSPQRVGVNPDFYLWKAAPQASELPIESRIRGAYAAPSHLTTPVKAASVKLTCLNDGENFLRDDLNAQIVSEHKRLKPLSQKLSPEEALGMTLNLALRLNQYCW